MDDPEMHRALREAIAPLAMGDDILHARVTAAAAHAAERLAMSRASASRYRALVCAPPPPRHATYVGVSDRSRDEMELHLSTNPHFSKWVAEMQSE